MNQGFTVFPVKNDELDIHLPEGENHGISRKVSVEEARELAESEFCTNKETINVFLVSL